MTYSAIKSSMSALALATSLALSGCVIHISPSHADEKTTRSLSLPANGLTMLEVEADAGSMTITGSSTAQEIRVEATIYTAKGEQNYQLSLEQEGTQAKLISEFKNDGMTFYSGSSPRIDLSITLPAGFNLDIDDESGDIAIRGMQSNITIDDDSGAILVDQGKHINIDDDSGDIRLLNIVGNVVIEDDSGSIHAERVNGSIDIEDDSGDITITNTQSSVKIDDDSGSIRTQHIGGAVTIDDESGDILVEHVKGLVTIKDGSGSIRVNHTLGLTIIDDGSGDVSFDNINGPVKMN